MAILIPLALVAGAIYAGVKAYPELQKQKPTRLSFLTEGDATQRACTRQNGAHFPGHTRRQQFQVMASTPDAVEPSEAEKRINHRLCLASVALGLASVGTLGWPALSLISVIPVPYLSWPIWRDAYRSLFKEHRLRVSVLDVTFITIGVYTGNYFALALAGFLYYVSRKLLIKTEDRSRASLVNVFGHQPRFVWVQTDGVEVEIPLKDVRTGDIVVVHAGETVPVDGAIASGVASIDQHLLTGESQPAEKGVGDQVFASTVVLSGAIHVRAERSGGETVVAQIGEILRHTADFKTSIQSRGEAMADKATPPFLALAALALPWLGPVGAGSVLGASFGYHLRILAPIGMLNFLTLASRHGILVKDGRSLELLHQVDTVVFDKTGTLTLEQPQVGAIYACNGWDENGVLQYAAAAECKQTHPIAKAILQEAATRQVLTPLSAEAHYEVGYGIKVYAGQRVIRVGSARYMVMEGIAIPDAVNALQVESDARGLSLVYVAVDDHLAGVIALHATVRPEAKRVVEDLHQRRLSVVIISGDRQQATRDLAHELGVDRYYAETLPEGKARLIAQLQREGRTVCFVGDGINDAIALKQANTSISLRGASTAATDTAQVILMDQSLNQLCKAFDIAKDFDANMSLGFAMTIIPGVIGLSGALLLHFGLVAPILLNNTGLAIGLGNAMLPMWKRQRSSSEKVLEVQRQKRPGEETQTTAGARSALAGADRLSTQDARGPLARVGSDATGDDTA
jgi:heavy metal translocating P-type ATPase